MHPKKKVMVFGVFDGLHEGHVAVLNEAKKFGDYIIAGVAQDHIVWELRGRLPKNKFEDRFEHLEREDLVDKVVIGDHELNSWDIVKKHRPDVVVMGYDQDVLKSELERNFAKLGFSPEIKIVHTYEENFPNS